MRPLLKEGLQMWPDRRLLDLFKTEVPIVQAPMAGAQDADIMIGAALGGALASIPTRLSRRPIERRSMR